MGGCLYFPSNLKDIKDHIQDAVVDGLYNKLQNLFTIKSNSFQRIHGLITTSFLLQQSFVPMEFFLIKYNIVQC